MVDWKSKPPHLCKNNPKLRLRRRIGLFLHAWDRFGFFNPPFLKSLDYHNHPTSRFWLSQNVQKWRPTISDIFRPSYGPTSRRHSSLCMYIILIALRKVRCPKLDPNWNFGIYKVSSHEYSSSGYLLMLITWSNIGQTLENTKIQFLILMTMILGMTCLR